MYHVKCEDDAAHQSHRFAEPHLQILKQVLFSVIFLIINCDEGKNTS